jgi:hypothetical protein
MHSNNLARNISMLQSRKVSFSRIYHTESYTTKAIKICNVLGSNPGQDTGWYGLTSFVSLNECWQSPLKQVMPTCCKNLHTSPFRSTIPSSSNLHNQNSQSNWKLLWLFWCPSTITIKEWRLHGCEVPRILDYVFGHLDSVWVGKNQSHKWHVNNTEL